MIFTFKRGVFLAFFALVVLVCDFQEHKNERHSDVSAALSLLKVSGSRVIVNVNGDLGHAGKGMENAEALLCRHEICGAKLIAILERRLKRSDGHKKHAK